jgi:hypothetical protein
MTTEQSITPEELQDQFDFRKEAFRLETMPKYQMADNLEKYHSYVAGQPAWDYTDNQWHQKLHQWVGQEKKRVYRLRLLPDEWTPYINFQIDWEYRHNARAGEEFFLIHQSDFLARYGEVPGDFWILDGKTMLTMNFDDNGRLLGAEKHDSVPTPYLRIAGQAEQIGLSLQDYLFKLRQTNFYQVE